MARNLEGLKLGRIYSYKHEHSGRSGKRTLTYQSWAGMIQRCTNSKNPRYKDYGGRGIKVCDRWKDFLCFLQDMGERPNEMLLDRINNDGNYEPGNCKWSTLYQSQNNQRKTVFISLNGIKKSISEWANHLNLKKATLYCRIKRGWTIERALSNGVKI